MSFELNLWPICLRWLMRKWMVTAWVTSTWRICARLPGPSGISEVSSIAGWPDRYTAGALSEGHCG